MGDVDATLPHSPAATLSPPPPLTVHWTCRQTWKTFPNCPLSKDRSNGLCFEQVITNTCPSSPHFTLRSVLRDSKPVPCPWDCQHDSDYHFAFRNLASLAGWKKKKNWIQAASYHIYSDADPMHSYCTRTAVSVIISHIEIVISLAVHEPHQSSGRQKVGKVRK